MHALNRSLPNIKYEDKKSDGRLNKTFHSFPHDRNSFDLRDVLGGRTNEKIYLKRRQSYTYSPPFKRFRREHPDAHILEPAYKNYQLLGDSQLVRFSQQLHLYEEKYFLRKIGYCVSGQTIEDLKNKLLFGGCPIRQYVITLIGTNDIIRKTALSDMCRTYSKILDMLKSRCSKIILLTVPPVPLLEDDEYHWYTLEKFNEFVSTCADDKKVFVLDLCSLFISYKNTVSKDYYESVYGTGPKVDLIHLNIKGFKLLKSILDIYFDEQNSSDN